MERLAAGRHNRPESRERKPKPNRVGHFLAVTLGSGVIAALLAIVIAAGQAMVAAALPPDPTPQIAANTLFPAVPPVHKVVDVYDPAPPQAPPRPQSTPTPKPVHGSPSPQPTRPPDD